MRSIHLQYEDQEFKRVKKVRDLSTASSWEKWVLELIEKNRVNNGKTR